MPIWFNRYSLGKIAKVLRISHDMRYYYRDEDLIRIGIGGLTHPVGTMILESNSEYFDFGYPETEEIE